MVTRKRYTLEHFSDATDAHCPSAYADLMNDDKHIESKRILNDDNDTIRYQMLLVGTMWYHEDHQSTWARATGLTVEYFYGFRHDNFVRPVPELHADKVYFTAPLKYVSGRQDDGMTKARRTGKVLVEDVLLNGHTQACRLSQCVSRRRD